MKYLNGNNLCSEFVYLMFYLFSFHSFISFIIMFGLCLGPGSRSLRTGEKTPDTLRDIQI